MRKKIIQYVVVPAALIAAALVLSRLPYSRYDYAYYAIIAFVLLVDVATILRGRLRDAAAVVASALLGLIVIELVSIRTDQKPLTRVTRGFFGSHPVLGWGPGRAGVFNAQLIAASGAEIYDVDYTIDDTLLRHTDSAPSGPLVAFFGDSFTFGLGVADADTLPQSFADVHDRKLRVLNLGFPGYGPQQFLRAVETGLFDRLLAPDVKLVVFETSAWHAYRSACKEAHMSRAPKYQLIEAKPVFVGTCAEGLQRFLRETFGDSGVFRAFVQPVDNVVRADDIELYIAEILEAARSAKQKYGADTAVLYLPTGEAGLKGAGFTDDDIIGRLRAGGVRVVDGSLKPNDFPPGATLFIPGDNHPTPIAHRALAKALARAVDHEFAAALGKPE